MIALGILFRLQSACGGVGIYSNPATGRLYLKLKLSIAGLMLFLFIIFNSFMVSSAFTVSLIE